MKIVYISCNNRHWLYLHCVLQRGSIWFLQWTDDTD